MAKFATEILQGAGKERVNYDKTNPTPLQKKLMEAEKSKTPGVAEKAKQALKLLPLLGLLALLSSGSQG